MCAHTHSKINTRQSISWFTKGKGISVCDAAFTAGSATALGQLCLCNYYATWHGHKSQQHSPDASFIRVKIHLYSRSSWHVCLDNHSKFSLTSSPRIVAKIINKLLVKHGVFLWRERRWFIFPVTWIYCLISFSLRDKAQFSQRPATTWPSEDKNSIHRASHFPQNQNTGTEDKAKVSISEQRKWPARGQTLPELCFKFSKPGSPAGVVGPALGHKAVEGGRAVWRHWEPLTVLDPPNHIIVLHSLEGLYPVHEDLPHTHTWGTHTKTRFLRCEQTMRLVKRETNPNFVLIMQFFPNI